jgi:hypothetical protein
MCTTPSQYHSAEIKETFVSILCNCTIIDSGEARRPECHFKYAHDKKFNMIKKRVKKAYTMSLKLALQEFGQLSKAKTTKNKPYFLRHWAAKKINVKNKVFLAAKKSRRLEKPVENNILLFSLANKKAVRNNKIIKYF